MADETTPFDEIWAWFGVMSADEQKALFAQIARQVNPLSLNGVSQVLSGAPLPAKKYIWSQWAQNADLSACLLPDILDLRDTETASVVYQIVKGWMKQYELEYAPESEIWKLDKQLPKLEDKVMLWSEWCARADLRTYKLYDITLLMSKLYRGVASVLAREWMKQAGQEASRQLRELKPGSELVKKIQKMGLPDEALGILNLATESHNTSAPKFSVGQRVIVYSLGGGIQTVESVLRQKETFYYWIRGGQKYHGELDVVAVN